MRRPRNDGSDISSTLAGSWVESHNSEASPEAMANIEIVYSTATVHSFYALLRTVRRYTRLNRVLQIEMEALVNRFERTPAAHRILTHRIAVAVALT